MESNRKGIGERNRTLLDKLHRQAKAPITPASAATILSLDLPRARRILAYLAARGWLSRIRQGLYGLVPLGADVPSEWREDPWVIVASVFSPCYIGGWSAAEHWHLTEQMFRDIVVITASVIRSRRLAIQGTPFLLKHTVVEKHFGLKPVWHGSVKVMVSDPTRTVVDILDDPRLGGGIRNVAEILATYFKSEYHSDVQLLEYADRFGNRAVFKRLGYLSETLGLGSSRLVTRCLARKSAGLSKLDPSVRQSGHVVKRWNLRVNATIRSAEDDE